MVCVFPLFPRSSFHLCDRYTKQAAFLKSSLEFGTDLCLQTAGIQPTTVFPKAWALLGEFTSFFPNVKECQGYISFHSVQLFADHRGWCVCLYLRLTGHSPFL
ncbi:hypothetical protein XENOCAPTIV_000554 [Xenoophorus captivus]|uniref:Uncharacterized protein n=1 Tax=Xenoophorus captivus TaxID=1517983 RepID=A0ABV0SCK0_9TELE